MRTAVLGSGAWGTAFAKVLADAGGQVTLWARRAELVDQINNLSENSEYLPGIRLPSGVRATTDPAQALEGADLVAVALPSHSLRATLGPMRELLPPASLLISLVKGVERGTDLRMSEVIAEVGQVSADRVTVVTGPNLAREIAEEHPAATVVACSSTANAERVQEAITTWYLRPYTNEDVIGCELGGAVKNVIALACGMAEGMQFGDNTKATLMTRGLTEIARLGAALGADPRTFAGLAGLGDLVATCSSPLSRNRKFGEQLGRGRSVQELSEVHGMTAEGVKSCASVFDLAQRHGVSMPIIEHVVKVIEHGMTPHEMVVALMNRNLKAE